MEAEALPPDEMLRLSDFEEVRAHEISYHVELLDEAGLIKANLSRSLGRGPVDFHLRRLTWQGHEFADAIKSDNIWAKTKTKISERGGAMTFEIVKSVAVGIAKSYVGL